MKSQSERAAAGAELLDTEYPQWHTEISLIDLEMASAQFCILGQLYHDFWNGLVRLGVDAEGTVDLGFDLNEAELEQDADAEYDNLQDAWIGEIALRQAAEPGIQPIPPQPRACGPKE